jgi:hypothetical protein
MPFTASLLNHYHHESHKLVSDPDHADVEAQVRIIPKGDLLKDPLLSIQYNHKLDVTHPFNTALFDAYKTDYGMPNINCLQHWSVQWAKRLKYVEPYVKIPSILNVVIFNVNKDPPANQSPSNLEIS